MAEEIPALTQERINKALKIVGEIAVAGAFKKSTFIYGTMGKGSFIVKGLKNWAGKARTKAKDPADQVKPVIDRELNLFDPGRRAEQYLAEGYQMMDLYYGQGGTSMHSRRIPAIAEFVHYAMGFKGAFSMNESGRQAYMKSWATKTEGWRDTSPGDYGHTATKEISRIIRYGIRTFGGTLIFEGREVYYSQVFYQSPARIGDTDAEARELFQYFTPGASTVRYGKGKLVFHWGGKEIIPTKMHFLTNWVWGGNGIMHSPSNMAKKTFATDATLSNIWNNFQRVPTALTMFSEGTLDQYLQGQGYPALTSFY
jgi:hypothetical protein